ncbi:hypothetical protein KEM56_003339, partial [Ascosphaera pollenicola]
MSQQQQQLQQRQDLEARARHAEDSIATATSHKRALNAAITAAELYLDAYRLATSPHDKKRLDARCNALLTWAESLKKSSKGSSSSSLSSSSSSPSPSSPSRPKRQLSKREQIILLEGSKLHGSVFPPWSTQPAAKEFERQADGSLFEDERNDLSLSDEQREAFDGWKRPDEALRRHGVDKEAGRHPTMIAEKPIDLVQDATTDCSVVASMCAVLAHNVKHPGSSRQLLLTDLFPRDETTHLPILSNSGKYILRLYFNGCYRKITIDDRLPTCVSTSTTTIHVIDRNNPSLLWPCLIEKGYLKIRGGYDFPGSNSGTDLWVLTGWIPEQIFLHDEESDLSMDEVWDRAFEAWEKGEILVTIGTGDLAEEVEREIGLIGMHDYSVLDMRERDGRREMLVKNPWASGVTWRGLISSGYAGSGGTLEGDMAGLHLDEKTNEDLSLAPGTFWMD